ncbi:MAG: 1-acyl-sn-glycerol-3-phosphate acyltransferase [Flavobacteriales bacterium]
MVRQQWSLWYGWVNFWVLGGLYGYFKKIEITGKENIPQKTPVLLALNHQNAFLDAIAVAALFDSQPHFLVRADVFKSPIAKSFFASIRMMPIYRERDGVNTVDYNKPIFEKCYSILAKGGQIILFPEGSHDRHKVLRPIKKGISRIAFGAEEAYDFNLGVQIVPVGINYSQYNKFWGTLHINIGKPVKVSEFVQAYKEHGNKGNKLLSKSVHQALSSVMVDYGKTEFHDALEFLRLIFPGYIHEKAGERKGMLASETKSAQVFISKFSQWSEHNATDAHQLKEMSFALRKMLKDAKLHPHIMSDCGRKRITLGDRLALVFGAPIFVFGLALHYLPFIYPKRFCENRVKDSVFHSSLKMAFGLVSISATYIILFVLGFLFLPIEQAIVFMFMIPLSGIVSIKYYYLLKRTLGRITLKNLAKNNPKKLNDIYHLVSEIKRMMGSFMD